jgi:hypothetical protein
MEISVQRRLLAPHSAPFNMLSVVPESDRGLRKVALEKIGCFIAISVGPL